MGSRRKLHGVSIFLFYYLINIFIYNFYLVSMAQLGVDSRMERELNTNIMDFTITVVIHSLLHRESIRKYMNLTRQKITAKDNGEDEHDSHSLNIVMVLDIFSKFNSLRIIFEFLS